MVGKRMFWGVVLLAILTLAACIATFSALAGSFQGEVILLNFAMNVPMCIIIGYADYKLVALLHKRQKNTDALSIVANVVVSNLAIGSLFILYYLISRPARFDEPGEFVATCCCLRYYAIASLCSSLKHSSTTTCSSQTKPGWQKSNRKRRSISLRT